MILNSVGNIKLLRNLKKIGFYTNECKYIFKNFSEERVKQALHYYWWLSKFKEDRKYEKSYIYSLLHNFDVTKTYLDYQNYLKNKKDATKLVLPEKKSYTIEKHKVGEDYVPNNSPKNILEFIKHGKKAKNN